MVRRIDVASWLSERRRSNAGFGLACVATAIILLLRDDPSQISTMDGSVLILLVYIASYLITTLAAFSLADWSQIQRWANREERGTPLQRYLLGTAPGPGVSLFFAVVALVVVVTWLPGHGGTTLTAPVRVGVVLALTTVSWLSVMISFAVTFCADNLVENEEGLDFPGKERAEWMDYVYFAVSVMTTFGTTDVDVHSSGMRRTITVNAIIAFIFNTVTVAASVSALTG